MPRSTNTTATLISVNESSAVSDGCVSELAEASHSNDRAELEWSTDSKSAVLSSFFYGYIITQVPGGWLADRFGGKRVLLAAISLSSVITLLFPLCARTSIYLVYAIRVGLGFLTAVTFPAMHAMWGRWAPPLERSRLTTVCYAGTTIGSVVTFSTSGVLCAYGFDNGWGSIFYITGALGVVWSMAWFYISADSPSVHPRIVDSEKKYILGSIEYRSDKRNGALSSIPYICQFLSVILAGQLADICRSKRLMSTTWTRKTFQATCTAACIVATGFCTCENRAIAVVVLSIAIMFMGFGRAGYVVNHVNHVPKYAGILYGITNAAATVPGTVAPLLAGYLTPNNTPEEWRQVFYVCAGFAVFGMLMFVTFASGEIQDWAKDIETEIEVQSVKSSYSTNEVKEKVKF